jgi:hypothetical protein
MSIAEVVAEFSLGRVAATMGVPGAIGYATGKLLVGGGEVALAMNDMHSDRQLLGACDDQHSRQRLKISELEAEVRDLGAQRRLVLELRDKAMSR